jgi:hypothetical protein
VIDDNLAALLLDHGKPPQAKGVRDKTQLVALTRPLYIEYASKEPSYSTLIQQGRIAFDLLDHTPRDMAEYCRFESLSITAASRLLHTKLEAIELVSSGAFLGVQQVSE